MASFAQPAVGFPVLPGDLVLPWRGLVAIGLVNVAMFMLRASAILVHLSPLLLTAILVG